MSMLLLHACPSHVRFQKRAMLLLPLEANVDESLASFGIGRPHRWEKFGV